MHIAPPERHCCHNNRLYKKFTHRWMVWTQIACLLLFAYSLPLSWNWKPMNKKAIKNIFRICFNLTLKSYIPLCSLKKIPWIVVILRITSSWGLGYTTLFLDVGDLSPVDLISKLVDILVNWFPYQMSMYSTGNCLLGLTSPKIFQIVSQNKCWISGLPFGQIFVVWFWFWIPVKERFSGLMRMINVCHNYSIIVYSRRYNW